MVLGSILTSSYRRLHSLSDSLFFQRGEKCFAVFFIRNIKFRFKPRFITWQKAPGYPMRKGLVMT